MSKNQHKAPVVVTFTQDDVTNLILQHMSSKLHVTDVSLVKGEFVVTGFMDMTPSPTGHTSGSIDEVFGMLEDEIAEDEE